MHIARRKPIANGFCDIFFFKASQTHSCELGSEHIERFLSHLTVQGNVATSTQRQALNALVFLYRKVLDIQLSDTITPIRSKRQKRPPVVLTGAEVQRLFLRMNGIHLFMAKLIYSTGLRLMEYIRLRIQDIDFGQKNFLITHKAQPLSDNIARTFRN